jgi:zinc D-Ala-D-Ala carboxypeptidase
MKFKYFTDEETKGMMPDVCFKLDRAREFFGNPIVLTCGYRDPVHNAEIGGVPNSAHTKGLAADIKAPADPFQRTKLAWALGSAGFRRLEIAPHHYHVDCDDEIKPSPCVWEGVDK